MFPKDSLSHLLQQVNSGTYTSWDEVHDFYKEEGKKYSEYKLHHAFASLLELEQLTIDDITTELFNDLLQKALITKEWMMTNIYHSRAKDYQNDFRKMVYNNDAEMEAVIGKLEDNSFIRQQREELETFKGKIEKINTDFGIKKAL